MKIAFISNYFNHHQKTLSDSLCEICDKYYFIATQPMDEERIALGWGQGSLPGYVIQYELNHHKCNEIISDFDIVIYGSAPYSLIKDRIRKQKIVFLYMERIFKKSGLNLKKILTALLIKHRFGMKENVYVLAASGYAASDFSTIGCLRERYLKWGYFPETKKYENINDLINLKQHNSILWVARFIDWKHPEACVLLAEKLIEDGYEFSINMIGVGPLFEQMRNTIHEKGLEKYIYLLGSKTPNEVRSYMEKSEIFISTSDQNEGWGAVINEAMNSGCAVIASNAIGAAPFLIIDDINGELYSDGNISDLHSKVEMLLNNKSKARVLGVEAYQTIIELWNGEKAAHAFVALGESLLENGRLTYKEVGPCSKADIKVF